ncbi:ABC transporter substrate-binding protein [Streptomyces flavofungini]|uniref:ABC transporter substrate-binding protein n=1 Tax=Streptomyces flavofungini TaxID=68200 RepID=A0ABS0XCI1_9ACTN|nr:ABC transporter substrate-binding protein [Streptomyces flavofungini]MBJ3810914.1 ABC transporter substrate-binding protein [Streptomyces flavofungini]GHC41437.1 ABC transporter substrate-binding protein [Streptomyces flavofungini]
MRHRHPARFGIAALALALTAVGCSSSDGGGSASDDKAGGRETTVTSCGRKLSFDVPPERAVALDQSSTEVLLELGLQNRMAGTSNLKTKIAPEYKKAYDKVDVLSPKILTSEQLRAATPDFTLGGFTDYFTKDRVGTREELAGLGLPSFVSAVDCPKQNAAEGTKSPFELLFQDYRDLGRIFGVEQRAAKLVKDQRATLAEAAKTADRVKGKPTVVWLYSVYGDTPYVAGKSAIPSEMSRTVGAKNAFDDIDEDWPTVTWEQIAERDPDFIVIGDLSERGKPGDSAADKLKAIRANPVMSKLDAVGKKRFIEIPGTEMDPSVRTVGALPRLAAGMKDLGYVR